MSHRESLRMVDSPNCYRAEMHTDLDMRWPVINDQTGKPVTTFDAGVLCHIGDCAAYGIYTVYKIGDGVYQISDYERHQPDGEKGAIGSAMYLVTGSQRALLVDLGNNYYCGFAGDNLKARPHADAELLAVIHGLIGDLPLDAVPTHMHVDHNGMTAVLQSRPNVTFWISELERIGDIAEQHGLDPSLFVPFAPGGKSFGLGQDCVVDTFLFRGHTEGGTVFLVKKADIVYVFTGDAYIPGIGMGGRLEAAAADCQRLVDHLSANFSPYECYSVRVYPAHAHRIGIDAGVDIAFHDWRFLQDTATLTQALVDGSWRQNSQCRWEEWNPPHAAHKPNGHGVAGDDFLQTTKLNVSLGVAKVKVALNADGKVRLCRPPQKNGQGRNEQQPR